MIYGLLEGSKTHLSEIKRSLKESITLKKTIERLSRNLHDFDDGKRVMDNDRLIKILNTLSQYFGNKCIRTLDRGFDANEYFIF